MRRNRSMRAVAGVVGVLLMTAACASGSGGSSTGSGGTIKIGFVDDLSAAAAESGNDSAHAAQFAVDEINQKGGIDGRKLELIVYDAKQSPELAAGFVRRLVQEGAVAITGANPAIPAGTMIPLAGQLKIPFISLAAASDAFTKPPKPYHLRIGPSNSQDAKAIANLMADRGFKAPALAGNSLPFGVDGLKAVTDSLLAAGIKPVASVTYQVTAADLGPQALQMVKVNPDVVVGWSYPADGANLVKSLKAAGLKAPIIISRIGLYDSFRDLGGAATEKVAVAQTVDLSRPEVKDFFARFDVKYPGRPPTLYIAEGYDAIQIFADALRQKNVLSTLDKDIKQGRTALWDAVIGMGGFTGMQLPKGASYKWSKDDHQAIFGDGTGSYSWYWTKDGKLQPADLDAWAKNQ